MKIWSRDARPAESLQSPISYASASRGPFSIPVFKDLVRVGDTLVLMTAAALTYLIISPTIRTQPTGEYVVASFVAIVVAMFGLRNTELYALDRLRSLTILLSRGFRAAVQGGTCGAGCLLILRVDWLVAAFWITQWTACATISFALFRTILSASLSGWLNAGRLDQNVAVVGVGDLSSAFIQSIHHDRKSRTRVVGRYSPTPCDISDDVRGDLDTLMLDCRLHRIDAIVIALPPTETQQIKEIIAKVRSCLADVFIVSDLCRLYLGATSPDQQDVSLLPVSERPLRDWHLIQKAVFDRVVAAILLVLLMPLLSVVAAMIRIEGPGPILFRQMRMGLNNNLFRIYKFRTMHTHMTDRLSFRQTSRSDPRVTKVGRVIRRLSIDELPQLLNVLLGDMSLVGPRPHAPGTRLGDRKVDLIVATYAQRHRVKPGITGLAQVSGYRGEMTTEEQVIERIRYDLAYIENWSIWLDIKIMFWTVIRESRGHNAY
jgi:Undecaprenyl-phosphate glucose phosphotransferase